MKGPRSTPWQRGTGKRCNHSGKQYQYKVFAFQFDTNGHLKKREIVNGIYRARVTVKNSDTKNVITVELRELLNRI